MEIIDLSLPIFSKMKIYPGDPEVRVEIVHTYEENSWLLRKLTMGSHSGTHVDAFSHMHRDGKTLDNIPLEQFFGKACIADYREPLPKGIGLIFKEDVCLESLERISAARPPFVGGCISESLERALLGEEIVTFTWLAKLDQLPVDKSFLFFGFPLRIKDGDGSPVRAVAVIDWDL